LFVCRKASHLFQHAGVTAIGDPPRAVVCDQRRKRSQSRIIDASVYSPRGASIWQAVSDGLRVAIGFLTCLSF
jgi:hypothetical protein